MKLRIGEYLVERGFITNEELELALHRQLIFGGRIGTNLVKLGLITEDVLISLLQAFQSTKGINMRKVGSITRSVLSVINQDTAVKYKCIPFEVSGSNIKLASIDVLQPEAIKDLEHLTGKNISPYIFPEVQWTDLMQEYYDFEPETLEDISRREAALEIEEDESVVPIDENAVFEKDELEQLLDEYNTEVEMKTSPTEIDTAELESLIEKDAELFSSADKDNSWVMEEDDSLDALLGDEDFFTEYRERTGWKRPKVKAGEEKQFENISVAEATLMLARATNREQVAITLLTKACNDADDAFIFLVKPDAVMGWMGLGRHLEKEKFRGFEYSLLLDSLFLDLIKSGRTYKGPAIINNNNRAIFHMLNVPWPAEICMIPIVVRSRVVAVIMMASNIKSIPAQSVVNMEILAKKAAITFEILIMKMKDS